MEQALGDSVIFESEKIRLLSRVFMAVEKAGISAGPNQQLIDIWTEGRSVLYTEDKSSFQMKSQVFHQILLRNTPKSGKQIDPQPCQNKEEHLEVSWQQSKEIN